MLIIAHRGARALEPENTLRAIRKAMDLNVDMIEIDIHQLDDQLIVIHDKTLDRTTNGTGKIQDYTFAQLRELDAGKGEQIPTLAEVLDLTRGKVALNIEIKGKSLVPLLYETIKAESNLLISSFDWQQLHQLRALDSSIDIGVLGAEGFDTAKKLNAVSINPELTELSDEYMRKAKELSLKVYTYTIRTDNDWKLAIKHQVAGCFVDNPKVYRNS